MSVTLDISDDYLLWDNTEVVDVYLRSISQTVRIDNALRRQLSARELSLFGAASLSSSSVVWEIPVTLLGNGLKIQEGDTITELEDPTGAAAAQAWTVVWVDLSALKTRWRCFSNLRR